MMTTSDSVRPGGSADLTMMDSGAVESVAGVDCLDGVAASAGPVDPTDTDSVTADSVTADSVNPDSVNPDSINAEAAKTLWDALIQARSQSPVISAAEDAVFRFYLPMARATARSFAGWTVDPDLAEQAAELGLANAVLAWRRADICAFAAFARAAMIRQMSATSTARARRLRQRIAAQAEAVTVTTSTVRG